MSGSLLTEQPTVTEVDPITAMSGDALWPRFPHMRVATSAVTGLHVGAAHAVGMLHDRRERSDRLGFTVPFVPAPLWLFVPVDQDDRQRGRR